MTGYLPVISVASLLAADTPSEQLPSDTLHQTWASQCCTASGGGVSHWPGQPANTTFRRLRARRNPGVIFLVTTSVTSNIKYLTPWPLGETARIEDYQGYDSQ
ncbi:TPA: hypothetical protein ACH3X3_010360 [Trebouxia sp. C0006]